MAYKKEFKLNPNDITLIEKCLRRELGTICLRANNKQHPQYTEAKEDLDIIQLLLGKLHNQKNWFTGTGNVASVPRG